jgi:hypothetical protein
MQITISKYPNRSLGERCMGNLKPKINGGEKARNNIIISLGLILSLCIESLVGYSSEVNDFNTWLEYINKAKIIINDHIT